MSLSDSQKRCLEQLAKDKRYTACYNCESQRVGVHEYESDWVLGGPFQVVLECPDCGAGSDTFIITLKRRGVAASTRTPTYPTTYLDWHSPRLDWKVGDHPAAGLRRITDWVRPPR